MGTKATRKKSEMQKGEDNGTDLIEEIKKHALEVSMLINKMPAEKRRIGFGVMLMSLTKACFDDVDSADMVSLLEFVKVGLIIDAQKDIAESDDESLMYG